MSSIRNGMGIHVGIIMDGNGRWATNQNLPRLAGHKAGVEAVKEIVQSCPDMQVHTVTLFAFAIANWKRDKEEVDGLWELFHIFITHDMRDLLKNGVRVRLIGNRAGLPKKVLEAAEKVEEDSKENSKFLLQIALNYDGVDEVARMVQRAIESNATVDTTYVLEHLDTQVGNEVDVLVRTGMPKAEKGMAIWRSSGFLPLQAAQAVCVSSETLWPDFTPEDLKEAIMYADPDSRLFGSQRK